MELEPADRSSPRSCLICGLHRMLTLNTQQKRKKLLDRYGEELKGKYPEWANL